jgi:hypothetical protein
LQRPNAFAKRSAITEMTILTDYRFFSWRWTGGSAVEQNSNGISKRLNIDEN